MLSRFLYHRLRLVVAATLITTCLLLTASFGFYRPIAVGAWVPSINKIHPTLGGTKGAPTAEEAPWIPKKLWYKMGIKGLSEMTRGLTDKCIAMNPGYEVEFFTESSADR